MRKLSSNDEVFHLSWETIMDIIDVILSRETPTPDTYRQWDEYAISFYLKMCTCFGVNYQHLEEADEQGENGANQTDAKEMSSYEEPIEQGENMGGFCVNPPEISYEERLHKVFNYRRVILTEPYEFGSYSSGTIPDRIPYPLYLLVKEAVDIMKRIDDNTNDLTVVENKIWFFCKYFHSHMPTGWKYERDNASSLIADGYDTMGERRELMAAGYYTPIRDFAKGEDEETLLTLQDMAGIMSSVHSRKMPPFWDMCWFDILFYCRICSCFGIDYQSLDAASDDDVCLLYTGVTPFVGE